MVDDVHDGAHYKAAQHVQVSGHAVSLSAGRDLSVSSPPQSRASEHRPGRSSVGIPESRRGGLKLHGRDSITRYLTRCLPGPDAFSELRQGPGNVHILYGLGGCGKTEIAWEVSQAALASGVRVWWIHAGGQASIGGGMREVASQLGAPPPRVDEAWAGRASATDLVWQLLNDAPMPWLLVLDNADWPEYLADRDRDIASGVGWLRHPQTPRGMVIVTSRVGETSVWGRWSAKHRVDALSPADGARVLLDYTGRKGAVPEEELSDAGELSRRLGGLPLALRAAGAYLRKVNHGPVFRGGKAIRSIRDYHDVLVHRFDEVRPRVDQHRLTEELELAAVHSTCEMSLALLAERGLADARPLLGVLARLAARPIPYGAVLNCEVLSSSPLFGPIPESRIRLLIDALDGLTLISLGRNASAGPMYGYTLTLHPLIRDVVLENQRWADAEGLRRLMVDLLDDAVRDLDPDDPDSWIGWIAVAPHCAAPVLDYVRWSANEQTHDDPRVSVAFDVIRKVSRFLLSRSLPRQAQLFLEDCLKDLPAEWRTRSDVVAVRHEYGRCLLEQGRLRKAEEELSSVLDQRTLNLGGDHPYTMATRHKLARCMLEQRQWEKAEANLREILAYERVRDSDGLDTLTVWHSLVRALVGQGHRRLAEASQEIGAVLTLWQRRPHPHPENLYARITAAKIMLLKNEPEGALEEITELLNEYTSNDWTTRTEVAEARRLRGQCLCALGRTEEGLRELQEVVAWQQLNLGPDHAETVATRGLLAEWG
ncbi:tetratricopeptide repeat protein [Streptomyces sp. URMC 128]|uniref:tetratricopeptide repeat protein n=1 Tax=Streptomyces sp. URMC 128 TaxID=3423404 RepID=UPI003F1CC6E5